ncbi:MAG: hypothetical protein AB7T10_02315 [bacterium]
MSKSYSLLILLIFCLGIDSKTFEGLYSVKIFPYSGSSEIYSYINNDTLMVEYETKVAFNTVKAKNRAKILLEPLKVISIHSEYSKIGVKSTGYIIFEDSIIKTYMSDAKNKTKRYKADKQPNDWLTLPFFLKLYGDEYYSCSMIHGDFDLQKKINAGAVEWTTDAGDLIVRFEDGVFTYLKAGKIEMKRVGR